MHNRTCRRCGKTFTADNGTRGKWVRFCSAKCSDAKPVSTYPPCIIDGCGNEARSSRTPHCEKHYYRLRRRGTIETTIRERREPCIVAGCERLDDGPAGYCSMHRRRVKEHGNPHAVTPKGYESPDLHPQYKGDGVGYNGMHTRLRAARGSAALQACVGCGMPAAHWSYDHQDPAEKDSPYGPYSTDPCHYQPRCVPCHKSYDLRRLT